MQSLDISTIHIIVKTYCALLMVDIDNSEIFRIVRKGTIIRMKTLIFNGSPRKNGDTASLLRVFKEAIGGDIQQIDAYFCKIKPCSDCRYCWTHHGCAIRDEMQRVYTLIDEADNIVIASPIYFSELTGALLNILSRLQYLYVSKTFRATDTLTEKRRNGVILLAGGGDGAPTRAAETAACLLHQMDAEVIGTVCSHNTNRLPACQDTAAKANIRTLAKKILSHI